MAAIISEKFRIFNAKQFLESLSEGSGDQDSARSKIYFFVGRPQSWKTYLEIYAVSSTNFTVGETVTATGGFTGTVSEVYPSSLLLTGVSPSVSIASGTVVTGSTSGATAKAGVYRFSTEEIPAQIADFDNQEEKFNIFSDMIAYKRINSTNARHVIRRVNWATSVVYDMWKPDYSSQKLSATGQTSLSSIDAKYAVLNNSSYEVFTCVYNGSDASNPNGRPSTYPPTTSPVSGEGTYADGYFTEPNGTAEYIWKYMFTIPTDDVIKFLSSDFVPVVSDGDVQTSAVDGAIKSVVLVDGGSDLPTSATLYAAITGNGTGGKVKLTTNSSGVITKATVEASGSGYSYANIILKNGFLYTNTSLTTTATVSADATGYVEVIIPPQGGYGKDPIVELNSKRIMTNIRLTYAEGSGDFPVDNDFRRIGLLEDPQQFGATSFFTSDTGSGLFAVKIQNATGNFIPDETITQTIGGVISKGKVVSWVLDDGSTTAGVLKYIQTPDLHTHEGAVVPFRSTASQPIVGSLSGIEGTVNTSFTGSLLGSTFTTGVDPVNPANGGLATPEVKPRSGELIYVENRRLITRAPDQIEDIKLVVEF
jgi:preprotein translocase subunit YajC